MSIRYYKGYKIGSLEKDLLKLLLGVKDEEIFNRNSQTFSSIFKTANQKKYYSKITKNLEKKGFLVFRNKDGELGVEITKKGKEALRNLSLEKISKEKRKEEWDGKWRIVMFDIPEKKRKIRGLLRDSLKRMGFLQIQGSVWIYPYPCEEIVTLIKSNVSLEREVVYMTANSFEKDNIYRKKFRI